jgi:hypothetical protein
VATVAADDVPGVDQSGAGRHRDVVVVLDQARRGGAELDLTAELGQAITQGALDERLGDPDRGRVRDVRRRRYADGGLERLGDHPRVVVVASRDVDGAELLDAVDDTEVVHHLEGAWLDGLGAGRRTRAVGTFDQAVRDATAGEVAREGQAGRPGADDEDGDRGSYLT